MPDTVIVLPCHNEAKRLKLSEFERFIDAQPAIRLLFVDDGSTDDTLGVLDSLMSRHRTRIDVLRLDSNQGKAEAVRRGMNHALETDARFIGYWDADLATPLETVPEFVQLAKERPVDIIIGSRVKLLGRHVHRNCLRHYLGRVFATVTSLLLDLPVYDTQCGAKLFARNIVERVCDRPFSTCWLFDVEIIVRYMNAFGKAAAGSRIVEYPLPRWQDVGGSHLNVADFVKAPYQLFRIFAGRRYG